MRLGINPNHKYPLLPAESCSYAWSVVADWNEGPPTSEPIIWCASEELAEKVKEILTNAKRTGHTYAIEDNGGISLVSGDSIPGRELQDGQWEIPIYGVEGWEFRFFYNIKEGVAGNQEIAVSVQDALDKLQY